MADNQIPCIESVVNVMAGEYFLRLWINRQDIPANFEEEDELLNELRKLGGYSPSQLVEKVRGMVPNLNAIEIKDGGCGVVAYLVDFNDKDPHG